MSGEQTQASWTAKRDKGQPLWKEALLATPLVLAVVAIVWNIVASGALADLTAALTSSIAAVQKAPTSLQLAGVLSVTSLVVGRWFHPNDAVDPQDYDANDPDATRGFLSDHAARLLELEAQVAKLRAAPAQ